MRADKLTNTGEPTVEYHNPYMRCDLVPNAKNVIQPKINFNNVREIFGLEHI
jgi:hypothetical protein